MYNFAESLRDLIDEKGLSLRELERVCGVSSSQFSRYLKGVVPTIEISIKLANFFGCSIDFLCGLTEDRSFSGYNEFDLNKFIDNYLSILKMQNKSHWKFAKENNFNEACLRHWKKGEKPKLSTLFVIAEGLDISIDDLIK